MKFIYSNMFFFINDIPKPIKTLNRGPAMDPAIPISPYPALAKATITLKSKKHVLIFK
jgi:hypothetical protein